MKKLVQEVDNILDGWFGEPLEYSENEADLYKYLYQPLRELVKQAYREGEHHGEIMADIPLELKIMYVKYWQSEKRFYRNGLDFAPFRISVDSVPGKYWFPMEKSECQWIVPGTVDPND